MKATQRRAEEQVGELLLPVIRLVHKAVDSSSPQSQRWMAAIENEKRPTFA